MHSVEILQKLILRTTKYFGSELGLKVNENITIKNVDEIHFLYTSAFVSLSDGFTGTIGISVERPLIVPIAENLMFCEISDDEIDGYAQDCTSEILNIILANTILTLDIVKKGGNVSITTPYIIKESTTVAKKKDGTMYFSELTIDNSKIILSYFY